MTDTPESSDMRAFTDGFPRRPNPPTMAELNPAQWALRPRGQTVWELRQEALHCAVYMEGEAQAQPIFADSDTTRVLTRAQAFYDWIVSGELPQ